MNVTKKHVAIAAVVLGLVALSQWQNKQDEKAAIEAYNALPVEDKIAIDLQKDLDKFYLPALRNDNSDERCGVKCLVTGQDVKENVKITSESNDTVNWEIESGLAFYNKMLEKEYPKNGMGAQTCEVLTSSYSGMLALMRLHGGGEGAISYLKATGEQKGERWTDYKERVYGGMVKFATMHNEIGIRGIDKFLHGGETYFTAAPIALRNENVLAREFENMCYKKGNVGMMQTIYLINHYYK